MVQNPWTPLLIISEVEGYFLRTNWCCRAATAALVEKQSREMLELINEKRSEYMMAESLYLDEGDGYTEDVLLPYPSQAPIPAPPALSKFEVYNDPVEFADVDQIAISVRKQLSGIDFNLTSCQWNSMGTGNIIGLTEVPCVVQSLS